MRTFGFLTLAAAAALSLVSAAPAPAPSAAVVHAASADKADAVVARDVEVVGVVGIFAELQAAIVEPINSCHYMTKQNATSDNITVAVKAIVSACVDATVKLGGLKGKSHDIIFAGVEAGVVVTVSVIASVVANVILSIFLAIQAVISVAADIKIVVDVLVAVNLSVVLCGLINAVLGLVAGLLISLTPLLHGVLAILVKLNLTAVVSILALA